MSTVAAVDAGVPQRIPSGKLAIWWFLASEIMTFGGLLSAFVLCRFAAGGWEEEAAHVSTSIAAFNTLILLTSSYAIVQAHGCVGRDDRIGAARYLLYTTLLGIFFLCVKGYEYSGEIAHGFLPGTDMFWSFYYGLTGLHALHVIGGIVANASLYYCASRDWGWSEVSQRVEYAGLYWHFVDVVWIFLFPLVYLT